MGDKKNIVVFMYNFPPIGAGRGIAWTYFARNLSESYNVRIITIDPSNSDPIYNSSKFDLIDKSYEVYRTHPGKFYRILYPTNKKVAAANENKYSTKSKGFNVHKILSSLYKKVIRSIIFPDRMIFWNKYAFREFEKINKNQKTDLVITVGFPFSTHILGLKIKQKYGCKLILDYGDPWSFNPSNETVPKWRRRIDYLIEKKVIRNSDYVTVTTNSTLSKYKETFRVSNKIGLIRQGVDIEQYSRIVNETENIRVNKETEVIKLFYSGIFYHDIRNPKHFFKALSISDFSGFIDKVIDITIAGKMEQYVIDYVNSLSFPQNLKINFIGNIPFEDVVRMQVTCDALLYFGNKGELQVPGKLYEYVAAQRPIFAVAPTFDESCEIILKYNRGRVVEDDAVKIKDAFTDFLNGIAGKKSEFNINKVTDYDWKELSQKYKEIVDDVMEGVSHD